jgi:pantoate--beta-alanine ligase
VESAETVARARALVDVLPRPLGFVPTMGALHDGHLELARRARAQCASVVASIFVNPLQFGPNEDLEAYPRDLSHDRERLASTGTDLLFAPSRPAMYSDGFATLVDVGALGESYEGAQRPGHFRGVTTVMTKLLNIVRPDRLYLGQKDAQQAVLLRKMISDLNFSIEAEIVPTVREPDGLAMSSRNRYLGAEARAQAPTLYLALLAVREAFERGESKSAAVAAGAAVLNHAAVLDYLDVVEAATFAPIDAWHPPLFVIGAARFGTTRLIDNLWVR